MTKRLDSTAGTVSYDNLLFAIDIPVKQKPVTVISGSGVLAKGSALAIDSNGKMNILGTASCTANCILAEDVDATSADVQAMAFITGHFNKQKLTVKSAYTITDADVEAFRGKGIILSDSLSV